MLFGLLLIFQLEKASMCPHAHPIEHSGHAVIRSNLDSQTDIISRFQTLVDAPAAATYSAGSAMIGKPDVR